MITSVIRFDRAADQLWNALQLASWGCRSHWNLIFTAWLSGTYVKSFFGEFDGPTTTTLTFVSDVGTYSMWCGKESISAQFTSKSGSVGISATSIAKSIIVSKWFIVRNYIWQKRSRLRTFKGGVEVRVGKIGVTENRNLEKLTRWNKKWMERLGRLTSYMKGP